MSFRIGDVALGPTFDALRDLEELEELGFSRVEEIVNAEGADTLPAGVRQEALEMARRTDLEMSYDARWTLHELAGIGPLPPPAD